MRRGKKLLALFMAAAILVLLPFGTMKANAAEPVTYIIKDVGEKWYYQVGSAWNSNAVYMDLYYMMLDLKDGDSVVIDVTGSFTYTFPVHLANLTVLACDSAVISANAYDDCYILFSSVAAINGDVKHAGVYGSARCTFNNNVETLEITNNVSDTSLSPVVTVGGTVAHAILHDPSSDRNFYNFAQGTFVAEKSNISTKPENYTLTAPAATPAPAAPAATPTPAPAGEYDDVPKTGDTTSGMVLLLFGLSAVCIASGYVVRRSKSAAFM